MKPGDVVYIMQRSKVNDGNGVALWKDPTKAPSSGLIRTVPYGTVGLVLAVHFTQDAKNWEPTSWTFVLCDNTVGYVVTRCTFPLNGCHR